jgi:hypothetical protein
MTDDDMKSKFEFLLAQQAPFSAQLSAQHEQFDARMSAQQKRFDSQQERLSDQQQRTSADLGALTQLVHGVVEEMRDGFNNLIVANEGTRELAQQTAVLSTQNSRRITDLEDKIIDPNLA